MTDKALRPGPFALEPECFGILALRLHLTLNMVNNTAGMRVYIPTRPLGRGLRGLETTSDSWARIDQQTAMATLNGLNQCGSRCQIKKSRNFWSGPL